MLLIAPADYNPQDFPIMSRQQAPPPPGGSRKISFNVSDQYDIQDVVGEGAYGVVWYAIRSTGLNHYDSSVE